MIPRILTMISSEGDQWGRYNLPRYLNFGVCFGFPIGFPLGFPWFSPGFSAAPQPLLARGGARATAAGQHRAATLGARGDVEVLGLFGGVGGPKMVGFSPGKNEKSWVSPRKIVLNNKKIGIEPPKMIKNCDFTDKNCSFTGFYQSAGWFGMEKPKND